MHRYLLDNGMLKDSIRRKEDEVRRGREGRTKRGRRDERRRDVVTRGEEVEENGGDGERIERREEFNFTNIQIDQLNVKILQHLKLCILYPLPSTSPPLLFLSHFSLSHSVILIFPILILLVHLTSPLHLPV